MGISNKFTDGVTENHRAAYSIHFRLHSILYRALSAHLSSLSRSDNWVQGVGTYLTVSCLFDFA